MQWKKNSYGLKPVRNRSVTYPPERGFGSKGRNDGNVFPEAIIGTLLPSSSYYPSIIDTYYLFYI